MSNQTKRIGLSEKQRKDAINRSLSGLQIGSRSLTRSGKKRSAVIERFSIAFTNAAKAE
ncbi:hypothetical protein GCM10007086_06370 [Photobacterium aphoticum]|uniref:hypothetical protein n=1 Tax=Photobacterium aphoticum TaxID=754436 RepID=UPI0012E051E5|nr:hypothetical protein [Photobacterium aphoticum]GHA35956.1 hypothetical protein GCM10007086_06370 [Photobacterium aphoticum]